MCDSNDSCGAGRSDPRPRKSVDRESEAVAIQANRIVAVGSSSEINKLTGPATKVIDLRGRRVVPGFNDAHLHFYFGGDGLASVRLGDTASAQEMGRRIGD